MKLIIQKTRLDVAVKSVCRVINTKNTLPILDNIMFNVDEEQKKATLTGSDNEMWLRYEVELDECEGGGTFCVDADMLRAALANLKEQPLTILATTEDDMRFIVKHETGETQMPMLTADEYPICETFVEKATTWVLKSDAVRRALKRSLWATDTIDLRPIMNGVCFDKTDEALNIVTSDGRALVRNEVAYGGDKGSFVMPKKAAKMLADLLDGSGNVDVLFDERHAAFSNGTMTLVFRNIEGRYPNYMSVFPVAKPYNLQANTMEWLKAARNVSNFSSANTRMVKLSISTDQQMTLTGECIDLSIVATDKIGISYAGDIDMSIGVKADLLIEALSHIAEPRVRMDFVDPTRALTITPEEPMYEGENVTMLLMPMMLNEG
jgi:DNA polymerase-3 subunit beta